ncbi:hypothetical protein [Hydrogenobacter thermophilus]|uniref:hypothetical protein n=1 Tax=Hydrogenobacter thermophilus TaxID=940 RepID=UPI0030F76498
MELLLLILAIVVLLITIRKANDETFADTTTPNQDQNSSALDDYTEMEDHTAHQDSSFWDSKSGFSLFDEDYWHSIHSYDSIFSHDDCDLSRALWDPSCPLYWAMHNDSSSDWSSGLSSNFDDWSSSNWDTSSSSGWDDWSSSNWDDWSSSGWSSSSWDT